MTFSIKALLRFLIAVLGFIIDHFFDDPPEDPKKADVDPTTGNF
jgi:hypothetical protein